MKILFTGKSDFLYNRTRIIHKGLKAHPDVEVFLYPTDKKDFDNNQFDRLEDVADFIYIPPFRHSDVRGIRQKTSKPIVFDPLISKYLTRTIDHGKWWTAPEKYLRDWVAFKNSDLIIMDTEADKQFIVDKYNLDPENVLVVPIGVDTSIFEPIPMEKHELFIVGFHGGFIPLQGVDKIVETAKILRDEHEILFDIVGAGSQYKRIRKLADGYGLENIKFRGWVNYDQINPVINSFDVCLGIFGNSIKTDMVIPNKVYEYAALRKCIVTKDSPAIKEIFTHDKNIYLTSFDPEDMARAILDLRGDPDKRERLAKAAYDLISGEFSEAKIGELLYEQLKHRTSVRH